MNKSSKLILSGVAGVLGAALVASGAYAAGGALEISDAPGQVLQVSGVGPASAHASETAKLHANEHAKGLFGTTDAEAGASVEGEQDADVDGGSVTPVAPQDASKDASTVKGKLTGQEVSAWAHANAGVEVVVPGGAIVVHGEAHPHG